MSQICSPVLVFVDLVVLFYLLSICFKNDQLDGIQMKTEKMTLRGLGKSPLE